MHVHACGHEHSAPNLGSDPVKTASDYMDWSELHDVASRDGSCFFPCFECWRKSRN